MVLVVNCFQLFVEILGIFFINIMWCQINVFFKLIQFVFYFKVMDIYMYDGYYWVDWVLYDIYVGGQKMARFYFQCMGNLFWYFFVYCREIDVFFSDVLFLKDMCVFIIVIGVFLGIFLKFVFFVCGF